MLFTYFLDSEITHLTSIHLKNDLLKIHQKLVYPLCVVTALCNNIVGNGFGMFTQLLLRAVQVLFSPMAGGQVGGWQELVCLGNISETTRYKKSIPGRDIG